MPACKRIGRWLSKRIAKGTDTAKPVIGQVALHTNEGDMLVLGAVIPMVCVWRDEEVVLRIGLAAKAGTNGVTPNYRGRRTQRS